MSADATEDRVQLLALLTDIHDFLRSGRTIHPNSVEVFNANPDEWTRKNAPTVTEYIGGILRDMKAEDILHKHFTRK